MRNFRELDVWSDARSLVKDIYQLTKQLPETEKYGLTAQINRHAVSIPANIAEGAAKYSQKDFVRFLQIGLGSSFELETHLIICADLQFIEKNASNRIIAKIQSLQKRMASLIKYNNK